MTDASPPSPSLSISTKTVGLWRPFCKPVLVHFKAEGGHAALSGCEVAGRKRALRSRVPSARIGPSMGPNPRPAAAPGRRPPPPGRLARLRRAARGAGRRFRSACGSRSPPGTGAAPWPVQPLDHALRTDQRQLPHAARLPGQASGDRTGREALRQAARVLPRRTTRPAHPPPKPAAAAFT